MGETEKRDDLAKKAESHNAYCAYLRESQAISAGKQSRWDDQHTPIADSPQAQSARFDHIGRELTRRDISRGTIARFPGKYRVDEKTGCWLWTGSIYRNGYGQVFVYRDAKGARTMQAHRVSYVIHRGNVPAGAVVMHLCDAKSCVNPLHLRVGTQLENQQDAVRKGRYSVPRPRKLSTDDVVHIRTSPATNVALAQQFGVSLQTIGLIRRGLRRGNG